MKLNKIMFGVFLTLSCMSVSAFTSQGMQSEDLRSNKEFIATCPSEYLTYIDKSEGGPGAYCACPDENISYIDKHEGGPGFYCAK